MGGECSVRTLLAGKCSEQGTLDSKTRSDERDESTERSRGGGESAARGERGKEGRARGVGELCEEGRALRGKFKQIFDIKHKRNDTVGITTLILQFSSDYKDLNFQKISYC